MSITNAGKPVPSYSGGGNPIWAYPQRGIGTAIYREIVRFSLAVCRLVRFTLER